VPSGFSQLRSRKVHSITHEAISKDTLDCMKGNKMGDKPKGCGMKDMWATTL